MTMTVRPDAIEQMAADIPSGEWRDAYYSWADDMGKDMTPSEAGARCEAVRRSHARDSHRGTDGGIPRVR
jgi:hypothetical protein